MSTDRNAILEWCVRVFGPVARDPRERALRLLEEVLELAQTQGVTYTDARAVAVRTFARDPGSAAVELGQAGMCLEVMAAVMGRDLGREVNLEFARVQDIPDAEFHRRHDAKVAVGAALSREG